MRLEVVMPGAVAQELCNYIDVLAPARGWEIETAAKLIALLKAGGGRDTPAALGAAHWYKEFEHGIA